MSKKSQITFKIFACISTYLVINNYYFRTDSTTNSTRPTTSIASAVIT
ncbi:MAG TPA: hypothetical protein VJ697_04440 [Nitrososphaeraceae archaeon]|nr:hypothetical protein [Nitrososphaeraceae archaeon]